jgi:cytochrome c biogenesis protein CcdA
MVELPLALSPGVAGAFLLVLPVIVIIALLDSLNPSLFLGQFYLMTTPDPVRRIGSYIAGLLAVNFLGGVLFLAGLNALLSRFVAVLSPEIVYAAMFAGGAALIIFGLWLRIPPAGEGSSEQPAVKLRSLRLHHSFALGALIMLNELTTALPYLAAIERIAAAELGWAGNLALLAIYNLVFAAPLVLFLLLFVQLRERFTAQIARISAAVHLWTLRIFKYGSLAAGVLLIAAVFLGLQ